MAKIILAIFAGLALLVEAYVMSLVFTGIGLREFWSATLGICVAVITFFGFNMDKC